MSTGYLSVFSKEKSQMKERRSCQKSSFQPGMDASQNVKCKIVVVGDSQCGKTALLHVFAKDCFPEVSLLRAVYAFAWK